MSFPKTALVLTAFGLLAGFAVSSLVTPRYVATAVVQLKDQTSEAQTPEMRHRMAEDFQLNVAHVMSSETISMLVQDPRLNLYKSERVNTPIEQVIAEARQAIRIAPVEPDSSAYRVDVAYPDRRLALQFANAIVTVLIARHSNEMRDLIAAQAVERDQALEARIAELETRLAALEARLRATPHSETTSAFSGVHIASPVELVVLDAPTVRKEFPNSLAFTLTGGGIGFLIAVPLARRNRYHV